jgi:hypothetical protein
LEAKLVEFMEMIVRCCDEASLPPNALELMNAENEEDKKDAVEDENKPPEMTLEER